MRALGLLGLALGALRGAPRGATSLVELVLAGDPLSEVKGMIGGARREPRARGGDLHRRSPRRNSTTCTDDFHTERSPHRGGVQGVLLGLEEDISAVRSVGPKGSGGSSEEILAARTLPVSLLNLATSTLRCRYAHAAPVRGRGGHDADFLVRAGGSLCRVQSSDSGRGKRERLVEQHLASKWWYRLMRPQV